MQSVFGFGKTFRLEDCDSIFKFIGERPYACDYPGCTKAFTQSGQLKTHQRLHSAAGCAMRFTHANRHCPEHPYDTLQRGAGGVLLQRDQQSYDVLRWLERFVPEEEMRARRKAISNPIGWLQEMCGSRSWPPPRYEIVNVEGLQHIPKFTIACEVSKYREVGTGQSKKFAKRQAALKVIQYFQELPQGLDDDDEVQTVRENPTRYHVIQEKKNQERQKLSKLFEYLISHARLLISPGSTFDSGPIYQQQTSNAPINNSYPSPHQPQSQPPQTQQSQAQQQHPFGADYPSVASSASTDTSAISSGLSSVASSTSEISQEVTNIAADYADLKGSKISTLSVSYARRVSNFYKNLKQSSGPKLSELQKTCLNNKDFNYAQFLEEIASEQEFEITYLRIEEKSQAGEYQYLVELSELPVAVCRGSGMTMGDAQDNAAQTALEYLKIITKK